MSKVIKLENYIFFKSLGFYLLNINTNILIYYRKEKSNIIIISLYTDNFLLAFKYYNLIE